MAAPHAPGRFLLPRSPPRVLLWLERRAARLSFEGIDLGPAAQVTAYRALVRDGPLAGEAGLRPGAYRHVACCAERLHVRLALAAQADTPLPHGPVAPFARLHTVSLVTRPAIAPLLWATGLLPDARPALAVFALLPALEGWRLTLRARPLLFFDGRHATVHEILEAAACASHLGRRLPSFGSFVPATGEDAFVWDLRTLPVGIHVAAGFRPPLGFETGGGWTAPVEGALEVIVGEADTASAPPKVPEGVLHRAARAAAAGAFDEATRELDEMGVSDLATALLTVVSDARGAEVEAHALAAARAVAARRPGASNAQGPLARRTIAAGEWAAVLGRLDEVAAYGEREIATAARAARLTLTARTGRPLPDDLQAAVANATKDPKLCERTRAVAARALARALAPDRAIEIVRWYEAALAIHAPIELDAADLRRLAAAAESVRAAARILAAPHRLADAARALAEDPRAIASLLQTVAPVAVPAAAEAVAPALAVQPDTARALFDFVEATGASPVLLEPFLGVLDTPRRTRTAAATLRARLDAGDLDGAIAVAHTVADEAQHDDDLRGIVRAAAVACLEAAREDAAMALVRPVVEPVGTLPSPLVRLLLRRLDPVPEAVLERAKALAIVTDAQAAARIEAAATLAPDQRAAAIVRWSNCVLPDAPVRARARAALADAIAEVSDVAAITDPKACADLLLSDRPPRDGADTVRREAAAAARLGFAKDAARFVATWIEEHPGADARQALAVEAAGWAADARQWKIVWSLLAPDGGAVPETPDAVTLAVEAAGVLGTDEAIGRALEAAAKAPPASDVLDRAVRIAARVAGDTAQSRARLAASAAVTAATEAGHLAPDAPLFDVLLASWETVESVSSGSPLPELDDLLAHLCPLATGVAWPAPRAAAARLFVRRRLACGRPDDALRAALRALVHLGGDEVLPDLVERACESALLDPVCWPPLCEAAASLPPSDLRDRVATALTRLAVAQADVGAVMALLPLLRPDAAIQDDLLEAAVWAARESGDVQVFEDVCLRDLARSETVRLALARLARLLRDGRALARVVARALSADENGAAAPLDEAVFGAAAAVLSADEHATFVLALAGRISAACYERALASAWRRAEALSPARFADLAAALAQADALTGDARDEAVRTVAAAVAEAPGDLPLHRALWVLCAGDDASDTCRRVVAAIASARPFETFSADEMAALVQAEACVGPREDAVEAIRCLALAHIECRPLIEACLGALDELGAHRASADVLAAWVNVLEPNERVEVLKRLAHVQLDHLGREDLAYATLEAAQAIAPDDPDVLLSLFETAEASCRPTDAVRWTVEILRRLPLGDRAASDVAGRGLDAAFSSFDLDAARAIADALVERHPDAPLLRDRAAELAALDGDAQARIDLLATVAERASGATSIAARIERALLLHEVRDDSEEAERILVHVLAEAPDRLEARTALIRVLRDRGKWLELAPHLRALAPRQLPAERVQTLQEIARIERDFRADPAAAERTLRVALDAMEHGKVPVEMQCTIVGQFVEVLQDQGRMADAAAFLASHLAEVLSPPQLPHDLPEETLALVERLAELYGEGLGDDTKAAVLLERLARAGRLPERGVPRLVRFYREQGRFDDLRRLLERRRRVLVEAGDRARAADVEQLVAELLEGPLGRPHEAAYLWLSAYLEDPVARVHAGRRARVLLSGTDAIANVARNAIPIVEAASPNARPFGYALLGDVLSPHEAFESRAAACYQAALGCSARFEPARLGWGRLLARQGRLEEAWQALRPLGRPTGPAAAHLSDADRGEAVALAARVGVRLGRFDEADALLSKHLARYGPSEKVLWERVRLADEAGRPAVAWAALEALAPLPLSSMLRAEVAYRRARLLLDGAVAPRTDATNEQARVLLVEAVTADPRHADARRRLADLARSRSDWSTYAQTLFLGLRDLGPSADRARLQAELAVIYARYLDDAASARRNLDAALCAAPEDEVVQRHVRDAALVLANPGRHGRLLARAADGPSERSPRARAALLLLATRLFLRDEDLVAAEQAARRALGHVSSDDPLARDARTLLSDIEQVDHRDLRTERTMIRRCLEEEDDPEERAHMQLRLAEVSMALGDDTTARTVLRDALAEHLDATDPTRVYLLSRALGRAYEQTGRFETFARALVRLADRAEGPGRARALFEAARALGRSRPFPDDAPRRLAEALEAATPGAEGDPGAEILSAWATVLSPDAARRAVEQVAPAIEAAGTPALALALADLARRAGTPGVAAPALARAAEHPLEGSTAVQVLLAYADALEATGRSGEALVASRRAQALAARMAPDRLDDATNAALARARRLGKLDVAFDVLAVALRHRRPLRRSDLADLRALSDELGRPHDLHRLLTGARTDVPLPRDRAELLRTRAELTIDHPHVVERDPLGSAFDDLRTALELDPGNRAVLAALLPVAFGRRDWARTQACAVGLLAHGPNEGAALLGGLASALLEGKSAWSLGLAPLPAQRRGSSAVLGALGDALSAVAEQGPLAHLDAVLQSAAHLLGGAHELRDRVRAFCRKRPHHAGLYLALGRLEEAARHGAKAHLLYQLAAFLTPTGPLARWVRRLPPRPTPPWPPDLSPGRFGLPEGVVLALERAAPALGRLAPPPPAANAPHVADLVSVAADLLASLRLPGPTPVLRLVLREAGSCVTGHAAEQPILCIDPRCAVLDPAEFQARLAVAWALARRGLGALPSGTEPFLVEFLDALAAVLDPSHTPATPTAARIFRGMMSNDTFVRETAGSVDARHRLLDEIVAVLASPASVRWHGQRLELFAWVEAVRHGARLDGVLYALSGRAPTNPDEALAVLEEPAAASVLRALDLV